MLDLLMMKLKWSFLMIEILELIFEGTIFEIRNDTITIQLAPLKIQIESHKIHKD